MTAPIAAGDTVTYLFAGGDKKSLLAGGDVPIYHKIAVEAAKTGEFVYKYGEKIGVATADIAPGEHVHIHNIKPIGFVEEA
ncbi:UxaA family hydrolase [Oscillospiraceae bacterium OttesenSCG-928-G22]|nr:UxaA family hydrolase [Oscillospiraceae bacterium OttesenSCG-928-G22]